MRIVDLRAGYVAHMRSEANRPLEALDELIGIALGAKVHGEVYHLKAAGEANWPWIAFGSDAESSAPEGVFLKSSTHPRVYGNFARLLCRYVRDDKLITLPDAVA